VEKKLTESKRLYEEFVNKLRSTVFPGEVPEFKLPEDDEEATQMISGLLHEISKFVYSQSQTTGGKRSQEGSPYFSDFHKFWEENHKEIMGIEIDENRCRAVAEKLEAYYRSYDLSDIVDTHGLTPGMIANVRLFVTIQDFGVGFKTDYYKLARDSPNLFRAEIIDNNPQLINELAKELGVADYQSDKRLEWADRLVKLLVDQYGGEAYDIGPKHDFDAKVIRKTLRKARIGLSSKKLNMYLRDMQRHHVWDLKNYEDVGVASDMNTMRVALRTGILKTRIPLLSSFLDVFCYQYMAIDTATEEAWRKVWEIWKSMPGGHSVPSPADMDFAIYRLGQHCCRTAKRHCDSNREIEFQPTEQESFPLNKLLQGKCTNFCIFTGICDDNGENPNRKKLNPPKSISRYGMYGWTRSTSNEGGGLGLRA
jgi:hypothetical protein